MKFKFHRKCIVDAPLTLFIAAAASASLCRAMDRSGGHAPNRGIQTPHAAQRSELFERVVQGFYSAQPGAADSANFFNRTGGQQVADCCDGRVVEQRAGCL